MGVLSFNGNKTITTGGGGAILTNDPFLAKRAKHLTTTAKSPHTWQYFHDEVGYNYRMPNLNAALGCAQLEQLPKLLLAKRNLTGLYQSALSGISGISLMLEPKGCTSNYWLQAITLAPGISGARDTILAATNRSGLTTRPVWTLMHELPPYRDSPRSSLSVAESIASRVVNLPSSASLG